jgi:hypothetical protein
MIMSQGDTDTTTDHQDALVFRKINRIADLWRQSTALDEASCDARRLENLSEAKELDARDQKVCTKAGAMEWEVIISNESKCEMVAASGFDKTWSPLRGIWDG